MKDVERLLVSVGMGQRVGDIGAGILGRAGKHPFAVASRATEAGIHGWHGWSLGSSIEPKWLTKTQRAEITIGLKRLMLLLNLKKLAADALTDASFSGASVWPLLPLSHIPTLRAATVAYGYS
ncbi:hypothetical protein [Gymnodinialimonas ulvae]|uniref:hypothetical protein n=1 Tax=Gymnodinialimonas ulvae TaxID=3126504 RepID=UPI0030ACA568